MKKILILLLFANIYISYSQEIPPPPPNSKTQKDSKKPEVNNGAKIIETYESIKNTINLEVCNVEVFEIESKFYTDKNSKYYYKTIENKLNNVDLEISSEEIIAYTKYRNNVEINPFRIDSIASAIYELNGDSKFEEAIKLCDQLKSISPNNITLHKELALAYKKIGKTEISEKHLEMVKIILTAVEKYSDGCRINPYILNNCFEGKSLYEAKFSLFPSKTRFILTESKKIIYGYEIYHIMRFADLNHYKKYLKKGEYKIE
jgi:hypothetical protein